MMKWTFILMLIPLVGFGQEVEMDTLAAEIGQPVVVQDEVILLADTVKPNFSPLLTDLEYIPADDSPELIADRLSCLQQTVPLTYNDKVHAFINYFLIRDRDHTRMVMRKKDLFFPLFEQQLKAHHLPDELKYLAIIESGLYPRAISRVHAVGLWQFMSGTGRYFGLKIDWYIDERMDPEKSTIAACKYLIQLHKIFKDWELALAAYNSGPGTVRRAIRRSGYKKSFWGIYSYLPRETRAYLPQYVAMIYALNHSADHNLFIDGPEEPLPQDTLHVKTFLHLNTLANLTGTCLEDLQRLNPAVQHYVIPADGKLHIVKMPVHAKIELSKNRKAILDSASHTNKSETEAIAKKESGNITGREKVVYYVKSGDAISVIAERFHVRTGDIKKWNNLSSNVIRTGQRLNIWVLPSERLVQTPPLKTPASSPVTLSPDSKTYIVQPGDTLWDISRKFQGLTIERIKSLNNLKTNKLQPGQRLIIG